MFKWVTSTPILRAMCKAFLVLGFIAALAGTSVAKARRIVATTCTSGAVQHALNSVSADHDVVIIPSGTCQWSTTVTYSRRHSVVIVGQTTIAGDCSPSSPSCVAQDNTVIQDANGGTPIWEIRASPGKSVRLTGFTFQYARGNTTPAYHGVIVLSGGSHSVRVDHNHWANNSNPYGAKGLLTNGALWGVIDHNVFDGWTNELAIAQDGWGGKSLGDGSWADSSHWGSDEFIFAENNYFINGFVYDCSVGARIVLRYNVVGFHSQLQTHGTVGRERGCRAEEIYGNTFHYDSQNQSDYFSQWTMLESGTALVWGNSISGFRTFMYEDTVRTNKLTYGQADPPRGWGFCGASVSGHTSPWDQNTDSSGYRCLDQVGAGSGDVLSGDLDSAWCRGCRVKNKTTGTHPPTNSWPHQALDPVYVWDNSYTPVPNDPRDRYWGSIDPVPIVKENRDFYLQLPNYDEPSATFNGTAGIGQGAIPPTSSGAYPGAPKCTPRVGYWDTGNSTLYVCTATNKWTHYYTPYTYPHPLVTASPTITPLRDKHGRR